MDSWPALSPFIHGANAMKRWLVRLTIALILGSFGLGCGGETGKGTNRGLDKPKNKEEKVM
jgi:hypothetical protein